MAPQKKKGKKGKQSTQVVKGPNTGLITMGRNMPVKTSMINDAGTASNSERVASIASSATSTGFAGARYIIAPLQLNILGTLALVYERHWMSFVRIIYTPSVGQNVGGNVYMKYGTDFKDALPTSVSQMVTSSRCAQASVWAGNDGAYLINKRGPITSGAIALDFPDDLYTKDWKPNTTGTAFALLPPADQNDYSMGYLDVFTDGVVATNSTVGYITMVYDCKFKGIIGFGQQG